MYLAAEIAQKIKSLAKEKNIKITNMLAEIGINKDSINTLSKGSMIQCDRLAKIADYLDCSVDYLLGRAAQINYSDESPTVNSNEQELLNIYHQLPSSTQNIVLGCLKYLLSQLPTQSPNKHIENITELPIPPDTTSKAARNGMSEHKEINVENLKTVISKPSEE